MPSDCMRIQLRQLRQLRTAMAAEKMLPKVLVFDLDGCCWDPEMYELWGGGAPFKPNQDGTLSDRKGTKVHLLGDVKNILYELHTDPKWEESIVAVASTCDEPKWARECLKKFSVGGDFKMSDVFREDVTEIYKAYGKDVHMKEIAKKTGVSLEEMIFFDNQTNNTSCVAGMNGPTVVYTPEGVTRELFQVITDKIIDRLWYNQTIFRKGFPSFLPQARFSGPGRDGDQLVSSRQYVLFCNIIHVCGLHSRVEDQFSTL